MVRDGMLTKLLIVGLGGAAGSILRYLTSLGMAAVMGGKFPYGTLLVNVTGCLIAGYVLARLLEQPGDHPGRLLIAVGLLGGLTTFSAFSVETLALAQKEQWGLAAANVAANLVLGLAGAWIGYQAGRA